MTIKKLLTITKHRPWQLPVENWKYYQEWNNAIFLHWQVDYDELRKWVPKEIEIDLFEGKPWISLVAFTMEKIRPKSLPSFPPISDFDEINIRTYVKHNNKTGVYFLSIEGGTKISCQIAKKLSELPYRYSKINRNKHTYQSINTHYCDQLEMTFEIGKRLTHKTELDGWLTERYALFQDNKKSINKFEIHHIEWPIYKVNLKQLTVQYPRFETLLGKAPTLSHYSPGIQVIAWDKKKKLVKK